MRTDVVASFGARDFEPGIGLGSTFAGAWFDAPGPLTDGRLGHESEQGGGVGVDLNATCRPFAPQLHGMFEAQLARVDIGLEGRLRHQQPDQVVGEQIHPQFLLDHLRRLATQDVHAECGLEVSKIELSGKGLARCLGVSPVRFQPLPIGTAREVFPQAARPVDFVERVMRRRGHEGHFHDSFPSPGKGRIVQSQYSPSTS
jgi:hypothetical protein